MFPHRSATARSASTGPRGTALWPNRPRGVGGPGDVGTARHRCARPRRGRLRVRRRSRGGRILAVLRPGHSASRLPDQPDPRTRPGRGQQGVLPGQPARRHHAADQHVQRRSGRERGAPRGLSRRRVRRAEPGHQRPSLSTKGKGIRIVAGAATGGAGLVVSPSIASGNFPANLKGQTLASPQLGNTQDVALRTWLSGHGLTSSTTGSGGDVTVDSSSGNSVDLQRFVAHEIAGGWEPEPYESEYILNGHGKLVVDEVVAVAERRFPHHCSGGDHRAAHQASRHRQGPDQGAHQERRLDHPEPIRRAGGRHLRAGDRHRRQAAAVGGRADGVDAPEVLRRPACG